MGGQPVVHLAAVPCRVLHVPGVAGGRDFLAAGGLGVQVKRQQVAVRGSRIGLIEDRPAIGKVERGRVVKAANAGQRAEVVVERAVLLHQHDDVLDVAQKARPRRVLCEARRTLGGISTEAAAAAALLAAYFSSLRLVVAATAGSSEMVGFIVA